MTEFGLVVIEDLCGRLSCGLQDAERVACCAEVRGTWYFQYERQRAVNGIEAYSMLAEWSGLWRLLRPRCRHGTPVAVGATAGCWLVG